MPKAPYNLYKADDLHARARMIQVEAKYPITIRSHNIEGALEWLETHGVDFEWSLPGIFLFKSKDDAMLFKLSIK